MGRNRLVLFLILLFAVLVVRTSTAEEQNQAGLVIAYGEEQVETYCISFAEAEISGYTLLERSDLELAISAAGLGAALCQIDETGCPAGNCFCKCKGSDCQYWSYWHLGESGWEYSAVGAGLYQVTPGEVDGWTWGPGSITDAIEPPQITLAEICAEPDEAVEQVSLSGTEAPTATQAPGSLTAEASAETERSQAEESAGANILYYALAGLLLLALTVWLLVGRRKADSS